MGYYIEGLQQQKCNSGRMIARVQSFFECDGRLRGFTSIVHGEGHLLDGLNAVFFTMSDGENLDFRENICMAWGARFGQREPLTATGVIPDFDEGHVYLGYATVFEDEEFLVLCHRQNFTISEWF
ncbi:MAG TPA: hypothetical protein VFZ59_07630 [Verrucomicrobiae bacterium]|nr:hypothetical protein [Verrucomicrobiae bacterium]